MKNSFVNSFFFIILFATAMTVKKCCRTIDAQKDLENEGV